LSYGHHLEPRKIANAAACQPDYFHPR